MSGPRAPRRPGPAMAGAAPGASPAQLPGRGLLHALPGLCLAALALLAGTTAAPARADPQAAPLPAAVQEHLPRLQLLGQGRFRWLGLHIYDAALWTEPDSAHDHHAAAESLAAGRRPLALRLRYARAFSGPDIARHTVDEMARLGLADPARRSHWRAAMLNIFPDVQPGSVLIGVHLPGQGARFFNQDKLLGEIPDAAFARAFFALWLHPQTRSPALREALLGRNNVAATP